MCAVDFGRKVTLVADRFRQHDNDERPNQVLSCRNQPSRVAFPTLPAQPPLPSLRDPDRWDEVLNGRCYVRKAANDMRVSVDEVTYYLSRELIGKYVVLRVEAATRECVVEDQHRQVQRADQRAGSGTNVL